MSSEWLLFVKELKEMRFQWRRSGCSRLILGGLLLLLVLKLLLNLRFTPRVNHDRNFFKLDSFETKGQHLIDYIANNLRVEYFNNSTGKTYIHLTNTGSAEIPADNWALYFNHAEGFISVANSRYIHIPKNGVILRHLTGWLFSLEPIIGNVSNTFQPLKPGKTLVIEENAPLRSKSYAFPKWYVSGQGLTPRVIKHTDIDKLNIVGMFKQWSPFERFQRNEIRDLKRSTKPIIPTPLVVKNSGGEVKLDKNWKISYERGLRDEATSIADKINVKMEECQNDCVKILHHTISLALKNLRLYFSGLQKPATFNLDEAYIIEIKNNSIFIHGQTSTGIFYGVQSLISLLDNSEDGLTLSLVQIIDAPRLEFRGLLLDVARNFIVKDEILLTLDLMGMYKMNKLHLHLTDDQGWRIEIPTLPELTEIGSRRGHDLKEEHSLLPSLGFGPDLPEPKYYSVKDYQDILRHANRRRVQVIPEIDMPGHAHAAIQAMRMRYKNLKQGGSDEKTASKFLVHDENDTSFYVGVNQQLDNVLNPCIESTYTFVKEILQSVIAAHKDIQPLKVIHFGGDEVTHGALVKSPACISLINENSALRENLKQYFMKRIISIANEFGLTVQTWEDGLRHRWEEPINASQWNNKAGIVINAYHISPSSFVFANKGYKVILTHANRLYVDHPYEPDPDELGLFWATRFIDTRLVFTYMYAMTFPNSTFPREETCRVLELKECPELKYPENIIGMQASLWGEMLRTKDDAHFMLYPRMLAFAERAWHIGDWESAQNAKEMEKLRNDDWTDFANTIGYKETKRLERLNIRYRIPSPGVRFKDGKVENVNTEFPGFVIQYSTDAGRTWQNYTGSERLNTSPDLKFSVMSHDMKRRGRVIDIS